VKAAKSAASKGNKGPKEKTLVEKQRKLLHPSYPLTDVTPNARAITNTDATPNAPWIKPDEHDDIIELKRQYLLRAQPGADPSVGPLGQMMVDKDDLQALKRKKDDEAYLRELSMAQLLIADDPALRQISAEKAYKIYPELQTVPEDAHKKYVGVQASLRTILRDGIIRGKDDNQLMLSVLDPLYMLPLFPLWDMDGKITNKVAANDGSRGNPFLFFSNYLSTKPQNTAAGVAYANDQRRRGLFNPVRYVAIDEFTTLAAHNQDSHVRNKYSKLFIMQRLYPQLKNASLLTLQNTWDEKFAERKSVIMVDAMGQPQAIQANPLSFLP
jgi:hypothetical protein